MKKVAILQSNYIPWKGYFDIINSVDFFVIYDSVQYTKRDWRNRNIIKTPNGLRWLTIPVKVKGKYLQQIQKTQIADEKWNIRHFSLIKQAYSNAKYFRFYEKLLENLFLNSKELYLSRINFRFISAINKILGIKTILKWSNEFKLCNGKTEKLVGICKDLKATTYLSGPKAKNYLNINVFKKENIKVEWMNYNDYPKYNQLYPPFCHNVSVLDLILNEGPNATNFMKSF